MQVAQKVSDADLPSFILGLYPKWKVVQISMARWAYSKSGTSRDGVALEWMVIYEEVSQ